MAKEAKEAMGEEGLELGILTMRLEEEEAGAQCGSAAVSMLLLQEEAVVVVVSIQIGVETCIIQLRFREMWEGSAAVVCRAALRLMLLRDILV